MKSPFLATLLVLTPTLLLGCQSDDDATQAQHDAAVEDHQAPDGAAPDGAAPDGATPDGASDAACHRGPLSFQCGTATCTPDKPFCCNDHATCAADSTQCPKDEGGIVPRATIQCDDADDCPEGKVCCSSFNKGNNFTDFVCAADCSQIHYGGQVCKQTCECLNGTTCTDTGCK